MRSAKAAAAGMTGETGMARQVSVERIFEDNQARLGLHWVAGRQGGNRVLTGEADAYRYLPRSLGPLPAADELAHLLEAAGLQEVSFRRYGLGTVALHRGRRPASP